MASQITESTRMIAQLLVEANYNNKNIIGVSSLFVFLPWYANNSPDWALGPIFLLYGTVVCLNWCYSCYTKTKTNQNWVGIGWRRPASGRFFFNFVPLSHVSMQWSLGVPHRLPVCCIFLSFLVCLCHWAITFRLVPAVKCCWFLWCQLSYRRHN